MNEALFAVTGRPSKMVGYEKELDEIKQAVLDSADTCHVFVIRGGGGLGKTRLLDEVLNRLGHPEIRERYGKPPKSEEWLTNDLMFTGPLDFAEARLLAREHFIARLGDPKCWFGGGIQQPPLFDNYQSEQFKLKQLGIIGASLAAMHKATEEAEGAFWKDYKILAAEKRLVLVLDTVEHLALNASAWMLDNELLTEEDLAYYTRQWLVNHIRAGDLARTTVLLAGREEEGGKFFELLDRMKSTAAAGIKFHTFGARSLDLEETKQFFTTLHEDWAEVEGGHAQTIAENLNFLLKEPGRLEVLQLYTGGQPVRLSMYADLLVSPETMPPPRLLDSLEEAKQRTSDDKDGAQKSIEQEFVQLLFRHGSDLQARILRLLVRASPGLTDEELHYVLDSGPQDSPEEWESDEERLEEIREALRNMGHLSLLRRKGNGHIGLQDEVYRIYTKCMTDSEEERQAEAKERHQQYMKLCQWTEHWRNKLTKERADYIEEDLNRIPTPPPEQIRMLARLREHTEPELKARQELEDALFQYELDHLYYAFVLNPNEQINEVYVRLASREELALTLENAAVIQAVVDRALYDEPALPFLDIPTRDPIKERGEQPVTVLRRVAQQYDAARWIMRLMNQGDYKRAIKLAEAIEDKVARIEDEHAQVSWSHPLARAERTCWREHAAILKGEDILGAIGRLERQVEHLQRLANTKQTEPVKIGDRQIKGFLRDPESSDLEIHNHDHPGYPRLLFTLSNIHNSIGYGHTTLGEFRKAVENYGEALRYFRFAELPAQQTTTMNNLSRALVAMGKKRAIRVCLDGLWLKVKKLGRLYSVGLSYNTLGLILNDLGEPQIALGALARALAIAHKINEPRLLGLVYIQLGEALRRTAASQATVPDFRDYQGFAAGRITHEIGIGRRVEMRPETIYGEAELILRQALSIFTPGPKEPLRLIESYIEIGCVHRDWMTYLLRRGERHDRKIRDHQDNALDYLQKAASLARERSLRRLELNACINIAWTYFRMNSFEEAEEHLHKAEDLIRLIDGKALLPLKSKAEAAQEERQSHHQENEDQEQAPTPHYLFAQLSKLWGLRGRMAFKAFHARQETWRQAYPLDKRKRQEAFSRDEEARQRLRRAAEAYTLAVAYSELFVPRSQNLSANYDDLYNYVKLLNPYEIEFFYQAEREARENYGTGDITLQSLGDTEQFLLDCFGDFFSAGRTVISN